MSAKIAKLLSRTNPSEQQIIKAWVRTRRSSKKFSFLEINDGSCLQNLQVIADAALENYSEIKKLTIGSAVIIKGNLVASQGSGQKWELLAKEIEVVSQAPESYPLQKKRHSDEFLRGIAHLRPRTNKYGACFRIRSAQTHAIHRFFDDKGFFCLHTPVITGSDCEGAGELFQVDSPGGAFFGKPVNLTVSGQLAAEMFALALGTVYTFGPSFRAENSNTARHAAEFWMVEPEMAFCDLQACMDLAQELIKYLVQDINQTCAEDIALFKRFVDKTLDNTLAIIEGSDFDRITYKNAVEILTKASHKFEYPMAWGRDLQTEHERFLAEQYFQKPVFVYDYPKSIKPFYMRCNADNLTVAAMDLLVPRIGELIGGSQREERLEVLEERMHSSGLDCNEYQWYLDSRRYGSVPHSGFGLGFERLLMLVTGITNIRDVLPFPRTPGNIDF